MGGATPKMAITQIRVGIIGAGGIGKVHIQTFRRLANVRVTAIADARRDLAEACAKEYGIERVYADAEAMLEADVVDAVVVAVPNALHAPLAVKALAAGKHVLLEKPMARDLDGARAVVRAWRDSGRVLMMGHQMRWEWVNMRVKELIDGGAFGRVYQIKTGWLRRKGIPGWGSWFTRKAESGGGALIDIGVHMLDLAMYLLGDRIRPVAVSGRVYGELGTRRIGLGNWGTPDFSGTFDVEDSGTALIRFDDGSTVLLDVSWAAHMETDSQPFLHVLGTDGGATVRGECGKLFGEQDGVATETPLEPPVDDEGARVRLARHFAECVLDGKKPLSDAMAGYANQLVLDAIYASSREEREIILDWTI